MRRTDSIGRYADRSTLQYTGLSGACMNCQRAGTSEVACTYLTAMLPIWSLCPSSSDEPALPVFPQAFSDAVL